MLFLGVGGDLFFQFALFERREFIEERHDEYRGKELHHEGEETDTDPGVEPGELPGRFEEPEQHRKQRRADQG